MKLLADTALVRPILDYGAVRLDPYREGQVGALDRLQKRAAKFANTDQMGWETFAGGTIVARLCSFYNAYIGGRAWKAIGDRMSREGHNQKIRTRKQITDIGKYFVNRTIMNCNKLPADLLESFLCNLNTFRKRIKKAVTNK
jgi:hypothetical protein